MMVKGKVDVSMTFFYGEKILFRYSEIICKNKGCRSKAGKIRFEPVPHLHQKNVGFTINLIRPILHTSVPILLYYLLYLFLFSAFPAHHFLATAKLKS